MYKRVMHLFNKGVLCALELRINDMTIKEIVLAEIEL